MDLQEKIYNIYLSISAHGEVSLVQTFKNLRPNYLQYVPLFLCNFGTCHQNATVIKNRFASYTYDLLPP